MERVLGIGALVERLEAAEWRREMLQKTLERLCELSDELDLCRHLQKCRNCQFELSLDVVRYGGNHSGIWYVSILDGLPPRGFSRLPSRGKL